MIKRMLMGLSLLLALPMVALAGHPCDLDPENWQNILFIELGTSWESEVKSNLRPDAPVMKVVQSLDGIDEINGKTYLKLWVSIDDGEPVFKSYIRIDRHELIYALDPQRIDEGEKLIYSFSSKPSDEPISWLMWDGSLAEDEEYEFVKTRNVNADVEYADWEWAAYKVKLYPVGFKGEEDACVGAVTWYWGMGAASGFTNQLYSASSAYTSTLKRVGTSCNGVVYDVSGGAGVGTAIEDFPLDGTKYRIDGTPLSEGEKGIYIMNGKKYIAR